MAKRREVEVSITFTSTWTPGAAMRGRTDDEIRDEVIHMLKPYLESPEGTLYADYGPGAWGGWEGPTMQHGQVSRA